MKQAQLLARRASIVFVVAVIGALATSLISLFILRNSLATNDATIVDDLQLVVGIEKMWNASERMAAAFRGYLLTGNETFKERVFERNRDFHELLNDLRPRLHSGANRDALNSIQKGEEKYWELIEKGMELQKRGDREIESAFFEKNIWPARTRLSDEIKALAKIRERRLVEARYASARSVSRSITLTIVVTGLALLCLLGTAIFLYLHLRRRAQELNEANRDLKEFCAVASHDLKSPLGTIIGYLDLLQEEYKCKLDSTGNSYVQVVISTATRMMALITELLTYSKVSRGSVERKATSLGLPLEEALSNLKASIDERKAVVRHNGLPSVVADKDQLVRVFQNLIGNGIKFQKPDSRPTVSISAKQSGKQWIISVTDNGIGIDPALADKIFEPFERLHRESEFPGHGLGLAVCKKIVERHGGSIWVESNPGPGATFSFSLPAV